MILLIDNYDSFTYNLYHYLGELGAEVRVVYNDKIRLDEIAALRPEKIVISPGPCTPKEAGISCAVDQPLRRAHADPRRLPGPSVHRRRLRRQDRPRAVDHAWQAVGRKPRRQDDFPRLKNPFAAMRYHSLVIDPQSLPAELIVSAQTDDGVIMAVRHKTFPVEGVQFHPESILAEEGKKLLKNFLDHY